jgi:hypothetical protein
MSTIQNLKNFIRHGKQARAGEPTSGVSPIHAQPQKHHYGISEPNVPQKQQHHYQDVTAQPAHYSVGEPDHTNRAAQAAGAAAIQAGKGQKLQDSRREAEIQAIVAEEREKAGKLPKYPSSCRRRWVTAPSAMSTELAIPKPMRKSPSKSSENSK